MPWSYTLEEDSESWIGEYNTREEVIEAAIKDKELSDEIIDRIKFDVKYVPYFYIGFGEREDPANAFNAGYIINFAEDYAYDNSDRSSDDIFVLKPNAKENFQKTLNAWAREYVVIRPWTIDKTERIEFPINKLQKKTYNKLIRDKILEKLDSKDIKYKSEIIESHEIFVKLLIDKLKEELIEFTENPSSDELADIMEVIDALKVYYPSTDMIKAQKLELNGGFQKRIYLEYTIEDKI